MKTILLISLIGILAFLFFINYTQNNSPPEEIPNPCDNSHLPEYHEGGQMPLNKMFLLESWDEAKNIPTVRNVAEPLYIPKNFELKFLYYEYHKLEAYYGMIGKWNSLDSLCPRDYTVNGFVIEYRDKEQKVNSELIDENEKTRILNSINPHPSAFEYGDTIYSENSCDRTKVAICWGLDENQTKIPLYCDVNFHCPKIPSLP